MSDVPSPCIGGCLRPYAPEASPCAGGCSPTGRRLVPYVSEAGTTCVRACEPTPSASAACDAHGCNLNTYGCRSSWAARSASAASSPRPASFPRRSSRARARRVVSTQSGSQQVHSQCIASAPPVHSQHLPARVPGAAPSAAGPLLRGRARGNARRGGGAPHALEPLTSFTASHLTTLLCLRTTNNLLTTTD